MAEEMSPSDYNLLTESTISPGDVQGSQKKINMGILIGGIIIVCCIFYFIITKMNQQDENITVIPTPNTTNINVTDIDVTDVDVTDVDVNINDDEDDVTQSPN